MLYTSFAARIYLVNITNTSVCARSTKWEVYEWHGSILSRVRSTWQQANVSITFLADNNWFSLTRRRASTNLRNVNRSYSLLVTVCARNGLKKIHLSIGWGNCVEKETGNIVLNLIGFLWLPKQCKALLLNKTFARQLDQLRGCMYSTQFTIIA